MSEVIVRERYLKNGKKVYEYCFELAHEGGKRRRRTKSGFVCEKPINKRMLICIACGNGFFEYRIEPSKTRRQRLC